MTVLDVGALDLITYVLQCPLSSHIFQFSFNITVCLYHKTYVCVFGKINIFVQRSVRQTSFKSPNLQRMSYVNDNQKKSLTTDSRPEHPMCIYCSSKGLVEYHYLSNWSEFLHLTPIDRKDVIVKSGRCLNCLRKHYVKDCFAPIAVENVELRIVESTLSCCMMPLSHHLKRVRVAITLQNFQLMCAKLVLGV